MNIKILLSLMIIASVSQASESAGGGAAKRKSPVPGTISPDSIVQAPPVVVVGAPVALVAHDIDRLGNFLPCVNEAKNGHNVLQPKQLLKKKQADNALVRQMNALQIDVSKVKNLRQDGK